MNQPEQMWSSFADMQRQMWQGWMGAFSPVQQTMQSGMQQMLQQNMAQWAKNLEPVSKDMMERMFSNQDTLLKLLEVTGRNWQAMQPKLQEGAKPEDVIAQYSKNITEAIQSGMQHMQQSTDDMASLWQRYIQESQKTIMPMMNVWQGAPANNGAGLGGLYWDLLEKSLGQYARTPALGLTREMNETVSSGFEAYVDMQRLQGEYSGLLMNALQKSFEALLTELVNRAEKGQQNYMTKELLNLWFETADKVFEEAFRTETYVKVQGAYLNAVMNFKQKQRAVVEMGLKAFDLPTRSEIDELHHQVYNLRKEIKALKKQLKNTQPVVVAASAAVAATPAVSASNKKGKKE